MPKAIEAEIRKSASAAGKSGEAADRYVYGALNNKGLMHGSKETAKGAKAESKFVKDHGDSGTDPVSKRKAKQKVRAKAVVKGEDPDAAEEAMEF